MNSQTELTSNSKSNILTHNFSSSLCLTDVNATIVNLSITDVQYALMIIGLRWKVSTKFKPTDCKWIL